MNDGQRTEIASLGEFGLIQRLTKRFQVARQPSTILGVGDDAAVIDNGDRFSLLSTDLLIEGIHFDLMYFPLKHLGYKAVVVNLSDILAMNGKPEQITVSLAISNRFALEALEEFYEGIHAACERYEVDMVGGDTSSSTSGLMISVTAYGHVPKERICYRSTAQTGDLICVTGDLGGAYTGLQLLEREKQIYLEKPDIQPDLEEQNYAVGRLLKPECRADVHRYLAENDILPTAMIDVSDGLSSDLMHLCHQSKLGCELREADIPIHQDTFNLALKFNHDPITCALNGGEDYELLFTIDPTHVDKISSAWDITVIGKMTEAATGSRIFTKGGNWHELIAQGWQHLGQ